MQKCSKWVLWFRNYDNVKSLTPKSVILITRQIMSSSFCPYVKGCLFKTHTVTYKLCVYVTSVFFWYIEDWRNWFRWKAKIDTWLYPKSERVAMWLISGGRVTITVLLSRWTETEVQLKLRSHNAAECSRAFWLLILSSHCPTYHFWCDIFTNCKVAGNGRLFVCLLLFLLFVFGVVLFFYFVVGIFLMGNSGRFFPRGKPAATESRYPTLITVFPSICSICVWPYHRLGGHPALSLSTTASASF